MRAFLRHLSCHNKFTALITVVSRNPMSPPDLTGNTPVLDILEPVQINLVKTLRYKPQLSCLQCIDRRFCKLIHLDKPLLFDQWLYCCTTPVMSSYSMHMWNNFYKVSLLIQICHDRFSCLIAIHSCIFSTLFIDRCIIVHDVDLRKVMTLSNLEIVRIMCRSDLNSTCSKLFVYIIISNDRNLTVYKWKDCHLSYDILISLIIRVYGDRGISQQRLRMGRCNFKETVRSGNRIFDMPEMSVLILMLHLGIRQRSLTFRTPVDDS